MAKTNFDKLEKVLEKKDSNVSKTFKSNFWSLKYGESKLVILPPIDDNSEINEPLYVHYGLFDSNGKNRAYKCSKNKFGKCPICERANVLLKGNNKAAVDEGNSLSARKVVLYNVLNEDLEHKILTAKASQQAEIDAEILHTYRLDGTDVTDLNSLRFIHVTRTKSDPFCRARVLNKNVDLTEDQKKTVLSSMVNLKEVYVDNSPEELERAMRGENINRKDDQDKEGVVVTSSKKEPETVPSTLEDKKEDGGIVVPQNGKFTIEEIKKRLQGN